MWQGNDSANLPTGSASRVDDLSIPGDVGEWHRASTRGGLCPATLDSGGAPVSYAVHLPKNYTASYPYPLIIWFHGEGGDEQSVKNWVPRFSDQNYIGVGIRGPLASTSGLPGEYRWSLGEQHLNWLEDDVGDMLWDVCQKVSIHSDRIVTAGIGHGATLALQMFLRRPDWIAGSVCLNAELLADWRLDWWGQYIGRKLWLGHSDILDEASTSPAISATRTLHAAGMDVTPRHYPHDEWPYDTFANDINHWLMQSLISNTLIV